MNYDHLRNIDLTTIAPIPATLICIHEHEPFDDVESYTRTGLLRTDGGEYVLAGVGGHHGYWSFYGRPIPSVDGHMGFLIVDETQARQFCEQHGSAADYIKIFGEAEEA